MCWKNFLLTFTLILSACTPSSEKIPIRNIEVSQTSETRPTISTSSTSSSLPSATAINVLTLSQLTPTESLTPTPDIRPIAYYWREWPIVPELSSYAKAILHNAMSNSDLDLHIFSKVGDCQMTSSTFLGGYANGKYSIPTGFDNTVAWFSESMTSESITAANGLGINSVLNPMFGLAAGHTQCERNETPLECELRTQQPAVVLIAMGTNWKPAGEISFEKHLRTVVDQILATGALPVLSTKADNIEGDWKLNEAIAQVAYDYDLPMVNVWRSVQDLPNHGLEAPKSIYLTGDGWMRRNHAWLSTLDQIVDLFNQ
ncbi:MAG: hypothetical protein MHPDNHAH_00470 [Anaerolineales bacterium]|nr:hypothetical protein [Anaerolineales bacterium]